MPSSKPFMLKQRLMKKKCLEAAGGSEDAPAAVSTCNNQSTKQVLVYDASTKRIKNKQSGLCLDDNGVSLSNDALSCPFGCAATFFDCTSGSPRDQQWEYDLTSGVVKSVNKGLCLTAWLADNTYLLWHCDSTGRFLGYYQQVDIQGEAPT